MFQEQCISVTDLRTKTKQCLDATKHEPRFIFVNNHPVAVLLGIREYEQRFSNPNLVELSKRQVNPSIKSAARAAKKISKKDLLNI